MENFDWFQKITFKNETEFSDCDYENDHVVSAV